LARHWPHLDLDRLARLGQARVRVDNSWKIMAGIARTAARDDDALDARTARSVALPAAAGFSVVLLPVSGKKRNIRPLARRAATNSGVVRNEGF